MDKRKQSVGYKEGRDKWRTLILMQGQMKLKSSNSKKKYLSERVSNLNTGLEF